MKGCRIHPFPNACFLRFFLSMPIYEFACRKCRRIYSFLSKRVNPEHTPTCPQCGAKDLTRELSRFALIKGVAEPASPAEGPDQPGAEGMPDFDDPRVARAMGELERDMDHLDENNPRHMAHMLRKMKDMLPAEAMPKEMEIAIKRLEAGEDPDKIEADMGDVLGDFMGKEGADGPGGGGGGPYSKDAGLYDY